MADQAEGRPVHKLPHISRPTHSSPAMEAKRHNLVSSTSSPPSHGHPLGVRRNNKPLMEKRRRARINASLHQLKMLVLDAFKKDSARFSKLEKSDILELTVKHLKSIQGHQLSAAMATDPTVATRFHNGFSECAREVNRYLSTIDNFDENIRGRLLAHLDRCMLQMSNCTTVTQDRPLFVDTRYCTQHLMTSPVPVHPRMDADMCSLPRFPPSPAPSYFSPTPSPRASLSPGPAVKTSFPETRVKAECENENDPLIANSEKSQNGRPEMTIMSAEKGEKMWRPW